MPLDTRLVERIRGAYEKMTADGAMIPVVKIRQFQNNFAEQFGPESLSKLDGEALLSKMHDHSNRASMVYWLEFKDDEEFPTGLFGGIGGGSALKFGIYRRAENGVWMTGSPQKQTELSPDEAVAIARRNRDQLIRGVAALKQATVDSDEACVELQEQLGQVAPNVYDTAWGRKYFSLLFPDKLDDFHSSMYQHYHLIRLFQVPPKVEGRYACASRFLAMSRELDIQINQLTGVLNRVHGSPRQYWRIGTSDSTQPRNRWAMMRDGHLVAIGWAEVGNLSEVKNDLESKNKLRELLVKQYSDDPRQAGRNASQIFAFVHRINEGDIVVAMDGATVLGIGCVKEGYTYNAKEDFPHQRAVEWLSLDEWKLPTPEGLRTTVHQCDSYPTNLVEIEKRIFAGTISTASGVTPPASIQTKSLVALEGTLGQIQSILRRKGQVILYGPPGTGKTYWAMRAARELAARSRFKKAHGDLTTEEKSSLDSPENENKQLVRFCCFHPAYGYEDFIEGYRPLPAEGKLAFELRDGMFKKLCDHARKNSEEDYYLVIDEINRGDIPRIFGELLTLLEKDKRESILHLPVSDKPFSVPKNVYLLGTMNTADRSIALLDVALRRRFGFVELMPDVTILKDAVVEGISLGSWLKGLNARIRQRVGRDARNLQIGHAYLMEGERPISTFASLNRAVRDDIVPLLQEYCYEDYSALEHILGRKLVDATRQQIFMEVFEEGRHDDLVQALLDIYQDVATTSPATAVEPPAAESEDSDDASEGAKA